MGNASDDEPPVIIEPADCNESGVLVPNSQVIFRVAVEKGSLSTASSRGSLYLEWSIITDATDIDGPENDDNDSDEIKTGPSTFGEESEESESSGEDGPGDEENTPDSIDNMEESGTGRPLESPQHLAHINSFPSRGVHLPELGPLKGYNYAEFMPTPINQSSSAGVHMYPSQSDALAALKDLKMILHPKRDTGYGYKDPELDLWQ